MKNQPRIIRGTLATLLLAAMIVVPSWTWAQPKGDKHFHAVVTDTQGVETDLKNVMFYWEEKVNETSFVPHELHHVPVQRGTATINVKFETIREIQTKSAGEKPTITIILTSGKTADFVMAIPGSFKGESDFGEVEIKAGHLKKLVFK